MKREIIHENQIRLTFDIEDLKKQNLLPTGDIRDLILYPDRFPHMTGNLGIDMTQVVEMETVVIDGGLIIELKLKSKFSGIKRAYYSSNIDDFYSFLSQQRIDGKLLYKKGNYIFIPYADVPQVLAEEYFLKPAVTEEPLRDFKIISDNALHDLIKA
jgi:hypothetical protein